MSRSFYPAIIIILFITACNNQPAQPHNPATEGPRTKEDSLFKDILDAHDVAMPKIGKLKSFQQLARQQLDSLAKLPAKDRSASAPLKLSLDSLLESLQYAEMSMDTWMMEFVPDSLSNDMEKRLQYLESEKQKATRMKDNVLGSIEKAKEMLKQ